MVVLINSIQSLQTVNSIYPYMITQITKKTQPLNASF